MVKIYKLHKFAGLSAGLVILILGITGFFIDHDKWSFLYSTTFSFVPESTKKADTKLFEAYYVDSSDENHIIVGSKRGFFESFDAGQNFEKISSLQALAIRSDNGEVFAATSDGVYKIKDSKLQSFALSGEYITSIALSKEKIVAVIDKHELVTIQRDDGNILSKNIVAIESEKLREDIKLSRFVRDLHYGRGLFDGDISLLINDYAALVVSFLAISGFFIWWYIRQKKRPALTRKLIRFHANIFAIMAIFPLLILAITGVFLDHSKALANFMKSVTIPNEILPPVYSSLQHDIWSVDYDGEVYRIGNRYGVYSSNDLNTWTQESKGLAYRMIRDKDILYVSGMGAPNKIFDGEWKILPKTPHMFRDIYVKNQQNKYFAPCGKCATKLPTFENATLYSVMLTMHDGTFFSTWWIWVNDYAALALLILSITGTLRWYKKRKVKSAIIPKSL